MTVSYTHLPDSATFISGDICFFCGGASWIWHLLDVYKRQEDIHYTVVETKAADGYILDETAHDVTLRYDDNAPDVVVATLKLANVPTEPKLPQTGDNANPLLYLGIGALALITGVGVGLRGRKKKNKQ